MEAFSPESKTRRRRPNSVGPIDGRRRRAGPAPFAGRVGGNLAFTSLDSDDDSVKRTPDAVQLLTLRSALDLRGFREPIIWKAALIECWGTGMLVFLLGLIGNALDTFTTSSPLAISMGAAVTTWAVIALFTIAAAPTSGGHLNPFITIATFFTGLCTLPRAILYIFSQLSGGIIGGFLLKLGLGSDHYYVSGTVQGCSFDTQYISTGEAFVLELGTYLSTIFLSFGVGLDPRQGQVLGPALSPILVGLVVAICSFGTGFVREGWSGASLNPARCFGLMLAKENLDYSWIHWCAAFSSAIVNGVVYYLVPPNPKGKVH